MVSEALRERFIEALQAAGGRAGNARLLGDLGWQPDTYDSVRDALAEEGLIVRGRGRGGSVSLPEAQQAAASAKAKPKRKGGGPEASEPAAPAAPERRAELDFEADLFKAADKLRGNLEPSEYKHVALGLIFLKYISEAFEAQRVKLGAEAYADPEDPEEYLAANVFWVPPEARWAHLQANAKRPQIAFVDVTTGRERRGDIGDLIDNAMEAIERANVKVLKDVLPKTYGRPQLDKTMLGELVDLFSNVDMKGGDGAAKDLLGRAYEYFISQFAGAEGRRGGEFFTPRSVVR
ncbi:MAG: type I restriction-modification system subunit M N-terminal domain-containing protein, partial [Caulobacteraceae bacterium]